jgi:hypothetical protein
MNAASLREALKILHLGSKALALQNKSGITKVAKATILKSCLLKKSLTKTKNS